MITPRLDRSTDREMRIKSYAVLADQLRDLTTAEPVPEAEIDREILVKRRKDGKSLELQGAER